ASADLPFPIEPQKWHFRQSIEYSMTANRAVLDVASRNKEHFLFNIYKMGKDAIEKGSKDTWTMYPRRLQEVKDEIAKTAKADGSDPRMAAGGLTRNTVPIAQYDSLVKKADWRDPRGYILSADQPDFLTATKFMNALIKAGVTVHRATAAFSAGGKQYPAGSYVVKTAQAFRPHVLDMFEPQDHPNDFQYPGGPPIPPYDNAGWTLAYQMGVNFDRILDGVEGPFEKLTGVQKPAPGKITEAQGAVGYVVSHAQNDAFVAVNRLLKANEEAYFLADRSFQSANGAGVIFIPAKASTGAVLKKAADDLGLSFTAVAQKPAGTMYKLTTPRIGLWDRYGGSMPSGWVRWLLEQYEFDFKLIYPQELNAGNLKSKFDVLLFPDGGIPEENSRESQMAALGGNRGPRAEDIPEEFRAWLGNVTPKETFPQLKRFAEEGGVLVAFGGSAVLGHALGLPVSDHLVEMQPNGEERRLAQTKFYIPGSILRIAVDNTNPVAYGFEQHVDVMYDNSPVLQLAPNASMAGVKAVAWFDSKTPLRSGWAWGQHYLEGGTAVAEASLGKGKVFLFGPEITFRAQPHGTFKFLFNSIYYGTAQPIGASGREVTAQP
ncbi:MAG: peptidase, partial [Acidobacteria bacterium]|nr:peptidase [Acidobacteriota bacterium]